MFSKKRKYEDENRSFKKEWEDEFAFVEKNGKPVCLLCQSALSQFKASNLKRHHDTHHSTFEKDFPVGSTLRHSKLSSLKGKLHGQSTVMHAFIKEADLTTEAGFAVAFNIARSKKPYTEGEFIKQNIAQVISILDPDNKKLHKMVDLMPASRHTIERRISVISADVENNLQKGLSNCSAFSLALDESTDIEDKPQLAIFVRFVLNDLEVKEELLDLVALKVSTRGCDIKEALDCVLHKVSVDVKKLVSVASDGAPAMRGINQGLLGLLNSDPTYPDFISVHCILHREHLVAKYFKYEHVMEIVLRIVNYIRSSAKTHREFKAFLEEIDNDELPADVSWFCLVRWLSVSNVLSKFFQLLEPIKQFLNEKGKSFPQLDDTQWLLDMAFFTDVVQHLQSLNISLQGQNKLISDLAQTVFSFQSKVRLFQRDLATKTFAHFTSMRRMLKGISEVEVKTEDYISKLNGVAEEMNDRFSDLKELKSSFAFLENPFLIDVIKNGCPVSRPVVLDSAAVELELLEIQEDEGLKQLKLSGCSTIQFWKQVPEQKYPKLKECAKRLISIFGTTYSCESLYSTLRFIKSKHRAILTDKHLNELVRTALTSHQPDFKQLTTQMDTRKSAM